MLLYTLTAKGKEPIKHVNAKEVAQIVGLSQSTVVRKLTYDFVDKIGEYHVELENGENNIGRTEHSLFGNAADEFDEITRKFRKHFKLGEYKDAEY